MTKKFISRAMAALCAAALVMGTGDNALNASSSSISAIEDEIAQKREENEQRRQEIENLGGDMDDNEYRMELISEQVDGVNAEIAKYRELIKAKEAAIDSKFLEIDAIERSILEKENEINEKSAEVDTLNAENQENLKRFAKLARALYMSDVSDKMPIFNGSSDWYDYFMYSDVVKNIGKQSYDFMQELTDSIKEQERLIGELNAEIDALNSSKLALEDEKAKFTRQMDELAEERAKLEAEAQEKLDDLYALTAENEELRDRIDDLESDIAANNAALEELNAQLEERIRAEQAANPDRPQYGGDFIWPLEDRFGYITTYFGYDADMDRMHRGIDVGDAGIKGTNIYAAQSGTVTTVVTGCEHNYGRSWNCGHGGGFGNYIIIDHGGGLATLYAHCGAVNVYEGQEVSQGDVIGEVGSTGWSLGFHLHFEVRENGTPVDPFGYV
ncbi:MAG: peptidoglycan DD-metalloendopeptidase family protein [Ruminococcaceae bacterium]|nr:peptidoglycan DD-metalloendopeptidase family protein [Oscillospiraceae bacterium]